MARACRRLGRFSAFMFVISGSILSVAQPPQLAAKAIVSVPAS
jgi:hypothetical protein